MIKQIRRISECAILIAIGVILSRFLSIEIAMGGTYSLNLGFGILPIFILAALYGPVYGCIGAICWDLVGAVLFPKGAYVVWFTLTAGVFGAAVGAGFSKVNIKHIFDEKLGEASVYTVYHCAKPISFLRLLVMAGIGQLIYSVFLNSLLISVLYGKAFFRLALLFRLLENVIMVPVNASLAYLLIKALEKAGIVKNRIAVNQGNDALLPCDSNAESEKVKEDEPQLSSDDLLQKIGELISVKDFDKAFEMYELLVIEYRHNPAIFNQEQKVEFAKHKHELQKNCPNKSFIVIEPAFDIENELSILSDFISSNDLDRASVQLQRINRYYETNKCMFSDTQKQHLFSLSAKIK